MLQLRIVKRMNIWGKFVLGLGEIGPEDPNFKIKTCAVGFEWEIEF